MPVNKSALIRYHIINNCLTNSLRKYPTKQDIIKKIEDQSSTTISESMFTKDLENMRKIYSAPIQYSRTHEGYFYTEPDFSISTFPLSHEEIEALDFSTALLQQHKHTKLFHHFETAINKVIDGYRISKIIDKSETQLLQIEEPVVSDDSKWLEPLLKAVVGKECLKLHYQGFGRPLKEHQFSPYLLKEYRNRWYTVGYSAISKHILVLALDRITAIEPSKENYFFDSAFVPANFFKYSFGITQINDGKAEIVELIFTPQQGNYILSQPLHHSQRVISNDENGVRITLEVYVTPELIMAILSYAAKVKVLAPASLIEEISKQIGEMNSVYLNND